MAKKKQTRKKAAKRKATKKKAAARKPVAKRKSVAKKPLKKKAAARKFKKKKVAKKPVGKRKAAKKKAKRAASLGRPKFTGEAALDQVFKEDYHARQIFTFLGVSSLKELEKFGPEEIVDRLSAPLVQTVQQIRKRLADHNRHLAGDLDYAVQRKQQRMGK
ncbi:hypothetical protein CA54_28330 [Symmachiella macrocystis]|uniref:Uncharacterized protein n=1 Tax=Symmachiella macrocystis TaxID=2527985 RepID=A0A5C6BRF2_9PLAN|nr:hypothetical protein [Symmachiella macrocystis]TWU13991.1 hypothetical protein CA54_28330 [Symmachiella macrocystis]